MLTCEFFISAILIVSSPVSPDSPDGIESINSIPMKLEEKQDIDAYVELLMPSLVAAAFDLEIINKSEIKSYKPNWDFVNHLRERYRNYKNMPRSIESSQFPQIDIIQKMISTNCAYGTQLLQLKTISNFDTIDLAIEENNHLHKILYLMRESKLEYSKTAQRIALNDYRNIVGYQFYYSGQLPPSIPYWRISKD